MDDFLIGVLTVVLVLLLLALFAGALGAFDTECSDVTLARDMDGMCVWKSPDSAVICAWLENDMDSMSCVYTGGGR